MREGGDRDEMKECVQLLLLAGALLPQMAIAGGEGAEEDSSMVVFMDEALIAASARDVLESRIGSETMSLLFPAGNLPHSGEVNMPGISGFVPNFFMPTYGSQQTGAVYIRGLGSRIGSPAVGLYVDDMPVLEKSTYNFNWLNVRRVDVLRGPQGTLYGSNTMGGLVHVHTADPLLEQGMELKMGASTRDGRGYVSLSMLHKLSDKVGMATDVFYEHSDGVWHNAELGRRVGGSEQVGGKVKLTWRPALRWNVTATAAYEYVDEDAYPYFYAGVVDGDEDLEGNIGQIFANRESSYRRSLLNTGLAVSYDAGNCKLSSLTSYQNLSDRMMMDQDFTNKDIYTLEQVQRSNVLAEEIVVRSNESKRVDWLAGVFGSWQTMRTKAPVMFYEDGIDMLNGTIAELLPVIEYGGVSMPLSATISESRYVVPGSFRTPTANVAVYANGTLRDVLPRIDVSVGIRLNYEHQELSYRSGGEVMNYAFAMQMIGSVDLAAQTGYTGKLKNDYTHLLPRFGMTYNLTGGWGSVYAIVSKGLRSGGYNIQMFSDVISTALRNDMMEGARSYCDDLLADLSASASSSVLSEMYESIRETMNESFPETEDVDIAETITYEPEYCWNYELGTHLNHPRFPFSADIAFFYIDTHNQQIVRFSDGGMGRMMVNAGRSRSFGAELSLMFRLLQERLSLSFNYGYTNAKFKDYDAGDGDDYSGNRVPFVPEHTLGAMVDYRFDLRSRFLRSLTIGLNASAFGRIYWTESNSVYQNFYIVPGVHALLDFDKISVDVWGKNLTQTSYDTFYFESMSRGFYQRGMPLQLGIDLSVKF